MLAEAISNTVSAEYGIGQLKRGEATDQVPRFSSHASNVS